MAYARRIMLRLTSILVSFVVLLLLLVACGGSVDDRAAVAGGTPAPDGASGYCCPARTGGCGLMGGYREEGECAKDFDICDGMCDQQIVKDAHGCDALTYRPCRMPVPAPRAAVDAGYDARD